MTSNKMTLVAVLVLMVGFGLVGCGSQSVPTSAASNTVTSSINSSGQPVAACSSDMANLSDLGVHSQVYQVSGVQNSNWLRVKFTKFPANFTNSNATIIMWSRTMDISGNSSAMVQNSFFLEVETSPGVFTQISQSMTSLTWSQLSSYASQNGVSTSSAQAALASINFVVQMDGVGLNSNILTAALYLSGTATADRWIESLIPSFFANPTDYAITHPAYMQNIHPLKYMLGGSYSAAQYVSADQVFCF